MEKIIEKIIKRTALMLVFPILMASSLVGMEPRDHGLGSEKDELSGELNYSVSTGLEDRFDRGRAVDRNASRQELASFFDREISRIESTIREQKLSIDLFACREQSLLRDIQRFEQENTYWRNI